MPGFVAQDAVEPLHFDLNPYVKVSGTIREPTDKEVQKFFAAVTDAARSVANVSAGASPEMVASLLTSIGMEQFEAIEEAMLAAVTDLCGGTPSRAQLEKLPHRQRQAFYGWLMGELTPKGQPTPGPS